METAKLQKLINLIKEKAEKSTFDCDDEFNPNDAFGGNMDDAYYGGLADGAVFFAQQLLTIIE